MLRKSSKYIYRQNPPNLQNTSPDCANFAFQIPILCKICIMNPQIPQNLHLKSPYYANFAFGIISHKTNARQYNDHNYNYFLLHIIRLSY